MTGNNQKSFANWLSLSLSASCFSLIFFNLSSTPLILTSLQKSLNFSSSSLQWIINAYLLAFSILILPAGKLSDLFGFRRFFSIGFSLYFLGSLVCALSFFKTQLILGRVIQGVGAASMFPSMGAFLIGNFPLGKRGKVMGLNVGIGCIFSMLGPGIAGVLTEYFSWRYLFVVNLPLALFGLFMTLKIVPHKSEQNSNKPKGQRFDYLGTLLLGLSIGFLTIALMQGAEWTWTSFYTLNLLFFAALFFIIYIIFYPKLTNPIIDFSLFKQKKFATATYCGCLAQLITMVTIFWVLYFQQSLGFCPITSGWAILLTNFPPIFIAPFSGYLADNFGLKWPVILGFCLLIFALSWITIFSEATDIIALMPAFFSFGLGMPLIMSSSYAASIEEVDNDKRASASSLSTALRGQLAPTLGMAIMSACYFTLIEGEKTALTAFRTINIFAASIALFGVFISLFYLPSKTKTTSQIVKL